MRAGGGAGTRAAVFRAQFVAAIASTATKVTASAWIGPRSTKTILSNYVFCVWGGTRTRARLAFGRARCIFFLTFDAKNLIKGTQPRSLTSGANLDVKGEPIDEERN